MLLAHSMGCRTAHYFLCWVKNQKDIGDLNSQLWIDKYIHSLFAAGGPFLGSPGAHYAALTGLYLTKDCGLGAFLNADEVRRMPPAARAIVNFLTATHFWLRSRWHFLEQSALRRFSCRKCRAIILLARECELLALSWRGKCPLQDTMTEARLLSQPATTILCTREQLEYSPSKSRRSSWNQTWLLD